MQNTTQHINLKGKLIKLYSGSAKGLNIEIYRTYSVLISKGILNFNIRFVINFVKKCSKKKYVCRSLSEGFT